jgi:hypothetical protein
MTFHMINVGNSVRRIFSDDKLIEGELLNRMGFQVMRTFVAHLTYSLRTVAPAQRDIAAKIDELKREGLVIWPDFLPSDHFEGVLAEFQRVAGSSRREFKVFQHGRNRLERFDIERMGESELPNIYRYFSDSRILRIIEAAEKQPLNKYYKLREMEILWQGPTTEPEDVQSDLHSDIFFHTHRAWLYLTDVNMESGPLAVVKRTHHLNMRQLYYIYRESVRPGPDGSRRITKRELEKLPFKETIVTCRRNTLVLANTCAYHRRLPGQPGRERHSLHTNWRANPFPAILRLG